MSTTVKDGQLDSTARLFSKTITATRDVTGNTADVAYTGVGFSPTSIIAFANINATYDNSIGGSDSSKASNSMANIPNAGGTAAMNYTVGGFLIWIQQEQAQNGQKAIVKSYDADGFTLTWTKMGTPSAGTINIKFICFR